MTTPSPSPPIPLSPPSAGERLARCTAPPAHSPPLPPSSGCLTQIQTLRIASTQALIDAVTAALPPPSLPPLPPSLSMPSPVDRRDDIPESEQPPRKRPAKIPAGAEFPRDAPMTVEEDSRSRISQRVRYDTPAGQIYLMGNRMNLRCDNHVWWGEPIASRELQLQSTLIQTQHQVHETRFQMQHAELAALRETDRRRQDQMIETLRVIRDMRREMSDMQAELLALREPQRRARQPGPEARIPDHQEASGDADSHI
ncbi:hypothetical protein Tco_0773401 [Tanacetum coccineum]|uniref:Uncharacterized protein n=1 Tax=Tanacetum coccineum TaxID=301880 RepID=A0ABQ4ZKS5_9ASTR